MATKKCSFCGTVVPKTATACPSCGVSVPQDSMEMPQDQGFTTPDSGFSFENPDDFVNPEGFKNANESKKPQDSQKPENLYLALTAYSNIPTPQSNLTLTGRSYNLQAVAWGQKLVIYAMIAVLAYWGYFIFLSTVYLPHHLEQNQKQEQAKQMRKLEQQQIAPQIPLEDNKNAEPQQEKEEVLEQNQQKTEEQQKREQLEQKRKKLKKLENERRERNDKRAENIQKQHLQRAEQWMNLTHEERMEQMRKEREQRDREFEEDSKLNQEIHELHVELMHEESEERMRQVHERARQFQIQQKERQQNRQQNRQPFPPHRADVAQRPAPGVGAPAANELEVVEIESGSVMLALFLLYVMFPILTLIFTMYAISSLARALQYSLILRLLFSFLMWFPLLNLIMLLIMNLEATGILKNAGYHIGFFGANMRDFH